MPDTPAGDTGMGEQRTEEHGARSPSGNTPEADAEWWIAWRHDHL